MSRPSRRGGNLDGADIVPPHIAHAKQASDCQSNGKNAHLDASLASKETLKQPRRERENSTETFVLNIQQTKSPKMEIQSLKKDLREHLIARKAPKPLNASVVFQDAADQSPSHRRETNGIESHSKE